MPFDLIAAWIVAGGATVLLLAFGYLNQRSGWQRPQRTDVILDSLWLSLDVQRREREAGQAMKGINVTALPATAPPPPELPCPVLATTDLFALNAALGAGVMPEDATARSEAASGERAPLASAFEPLSR
jgi:hypothetical protein